MLPTPEDVVEACSYNIQDGLGECDVVDLPASYGVWDDGHADQSAHLSNAYNGWAESPANCPTAATAHFHPLQIGPDVSGQQCRPSRGSINPVTGKRYKYRSSLASRNGAPRRRKNAAATAWQQQATTPTVASQFQRAAAPPYVPPPPPPPPRRPQGLPSSMPAATAGSTSKLSDLLPGVHIHSPGSVLYGSPPDMSVSICIPEWGAGIPDHVCPLVPQLQQRRMQATPAAGLSLGAAGLGGAPGTTQLPDWMLQRKGLPGQQLLPEAPDLDRRAAADASKPILWSGGLPSKPLSAAAGSSPPRGLLLPPNAQPLYIGSSSTGSTTSPVAAAATALSDCDLDVLLGAAAGITTSSSLLQASGCDLSMSAATAGMLPLDLEVSLGCCSSSGASNWGEALSQAAAATGCWEATGLLGLDDGGEALSGEGALLLPQQLLAELPLGPTGGCGVPGMSLAPVTTGLAGQAPCSTPLAPPAATTPTARVVGLADAPEGLELLQVPLPAAQAKLVASNMATIAHASGAQLALTPTSGGGLLLTLSGALPQLLQARQLVKSLLLPPPDVTGLWPQAR